MGIIGTDAALPTGAPFVRPYRGETIGVGPPIRPADAGLTRSTNRVRREITDRVMTEIQHLCHRQYVDRYAPLPPGHHASTTASSLGGG
jgi:hypothetical protein